MWVTSYVPAAVLLTTGRQIVATALSVLSVGVTSVVTVPVLVTLTQPVVVSVNALAFAVTLTLTSRLPAGGIVTVQLTFWPTIVHEPDEPVLGLITVALTPVTPTGSGSETVLLVATPLPLFATWRFQSNESPTKCVPVFGVLTIERSGRQVLMSPRT